MAGVLCEAYRQIAVERERESDEGEGEKSENDVTAKAVRLLMSTSLVRPFHSAPYPRASLIFPCSQRSMIILPVIYLLAIPLGLQDPHRNHDQPLRLGVLFAYPFVASIATSSLNFSIFTNTFDLFSSIFAYNASNALRLAMLYLTTARNSSTVRLPLIVNCIANAVMYTIMLRLPSSTKIDLPAYSSLSASSTPFVSRQSHRLIASVPVLIPLIWILRLLATHHTVDVVVAHYSIPLPDLKSFIADIRAAPLVRSSRTRVIIYEKGDFTTEQLWRGLSGVARPGRDLEVVHLPNYGREGHTYLSHITALYSDTLPLVDGGRLAAAKHHSSRLFGRKGHSIADHTLFLQSHLAWSYIAEGRLAYTLRANSGFVSFGPYLSTSCGADSEGTGFYFGVPRIFEGVMGRPCKEGIEDDRVLSTWAGQFAASRERVMANSYEFWDELRRTLEVRCFSVLSSSSPSHPHPSHSCRTTTRYTKGGTRPLRRLRSAFCPFLLLSASFPSFAFVLTLSFPSRRAATPPSATRSSAPGRSSCAARTRRLPSSVGIRNGRRTSASASICRLGDEFNALLCLFCCIYRH